MDQRVKWAKCPLTVFAWAILVLTHAGSSTPFENFEAAVRESAASGMVGESVRLGCEVDKESCGAFHSVKWYKGNDRVFIFSEIAEVKRPEGALLERTEFDYVEGRKENWLEIYPVRPSDEGTYKCEITYLAVKEACSVVQFVHLKTLARPLSFELSFGDGSKIANGSRAGPFLEGDDLTLVCGAGQAKPVPALKWLNRSQTIQGRFESSVEENELFVATESIEMSLSRADIGLTLVCEVFNEAMEGPVSLSVTLDVLVAPVSVKLESSVATLRAGRAASLLCVAAGANPAPELAWFNGSTPINQTQQQSHIKMNFARMKMDDGTFTLESKLTFEASEYDHGRVFRCEATNHVLHVKNEPPLAADLALDVHYRPKVQVSPSNQTVNESMDFIVFCEFSANPSDLTHVYWYLDGRQLDVAGAPEKYRNGDARHPSLLVANASAADSGAYTCRLANAVGESDVAADSQVVVQYPPKVVLKVDPEGPFSAESPTNVTLICDVVSAFPDALAKVRWFMDGELLKELPECESASGGEGGVESDFCDLDPSRLLLEYVMKEFHGNYTCEGMNAAGWGEPSPPAPVVVNYRPDMATLQYSPPTVIKGHPVTLNCTPLDPGRPAAESFRWHRNSLLVPDVTAAVWHVDSASLETKANYTCLAINSQGESNVANININVLAAPTFITRLPTYHGALINADDVSLTCHVECSPNCSVSWLKDNRPFDNDTHYNVRSVYLLPDSDSGDFESVKSILSWKMDMWPSGQLHREIDNANYTCISSANVAGDGVSSNTVFRVEYPPESIEISAERLQVIEGEIPGRVLCSASSYPEADVYWVHQDETVMTGGTLNLGFPIGRDRAGTYSCVAENRHGKQVVATELDVLFKPECKIDRSDSNEEKPSIVLTCRAVANPQDLYFRWRVGNESVTEGVSRAGAASRLVLPAEPASLGTYVCYANNSVGESIPCEIDVTGLLETLGEDNAVLYAVVAVLLLVLIVALALLLLWCRRQRKTGKFAHSDTPTKENPECSINKHSIPPSNLPVLSAASTIASSKLLHKWPLKPGVQVHVNSLTSLADESKNFYNLNSNTNSTTVSTSSYPCDGNQNSASTLPKIPSQSLIKTAHAQSKANSFLLQRSLYPPVNTNKRSASSSSSSSLSSSNISNGRVPAIHTMPRHTSVDAANEFDRAKWGVVSFPAKSTSTPKYSHTSARKPRPNSIFHNYSTNISKSALRDAHSLPDYSRRRRKSKKRSSNGADSDPASRGEAIPRKDGAPGTQGTRPSSPCEDEPPTFYENLPFHGIQPPPNKTSCESNESPTDSLGGDDETRSCSRLSREASSGYGSTRSHAPKSASSEGRQKSHQSEVQARENLAKNARPGIVERRSRGYSSLKNVPFNAARHFMARTSNYFSVKLPRESNVHSIRNPAIKSNHELPSSIEVPHNILKNESNEDRPAVISRRDPHSNTKESEMNNNMSKDICIEEIDGQNKWQCISGKDASFALLKTETAPTPAPRHALPRVFPAYQNVPEPNFRNRLTTSGINKFSHQAKKHELVTKEFQLKSTFGDSSPRQNYKHSISPESSDSSQSSSCYQQPYNSRDRGKGSFADYAPKKQSPPNYSSYSASSFRRQSQPSSINGSFSSIPYYHHQPPSVQSLRSANQSMPYADLNINRNGLPNHYHKNLSLEYPGQYQEINSPIVGQEIDV